MVESEGEVHRLHPILPKRKTKAASSPDNKKITVDFHTDATYKNRIPNRAFIVNDSNREDFLNQEKYKKQRKDDDRFRKEVEDMQTVECIARLLSAPGHCHIVNVLDQRA